MRLFITVKPMPGDTSAAVACHRSGFKAETRAESYRGPGHDGVRYSSARKHFSSNKMQRLPAAQASREACRPALPARSERGLIICEFVVAS
jgi:hypothetical protein